MRDPLGVAHAIGVGEGRLRPACGRRRTRGGFGRIRARRHPLTRLSTTLTMSESADSLPCMGTNDSIWTSDQQLLFMGTIRQALNSGQQINSRFVDGLTQTTGYSGSVRSPQSKILRTAIRLQVLERKRQQRGANIDRLSRVIHQRNERILVLRRKHGAKRIGGLKLLDEMNRLSAANDASRRRQLKDDRKCDQLDARIEKCARTIDRLHTNALRSE